MKNLFQNFSSDYYLLLNILEHNVFDKVNLYAYKEFHSLESSLEFANTEAGKNFLFNTYLTNSQSSFDKCLINKIEKIKPSYKKPYKEMRLVMFPKESHFSLFYSSRKTREDNSVAGSGFLFIHSNIIDFLKKISSYSSSYNYFVTYMTLGYINEKNELVLDIYIGLSTFFFNYNFLLEHDYYSSYNSYTIHKKYCLFNEMEEESKVVFAPLSSSEDIIHKVLESNEYDIPYDEQNHYIKDSVKVNIRDFELNDSYKDLLQTYQIDYFYNPWLLERPRDFNHFYIEKNINPHQYVVDYTIFYFGLLYEIVINNNIFYNQNFFKNIPKPNILNLNK